MWFCYLRFYVFISELVGSIVVFVGYDGGFGVVGFVFILGFGG